MAGLDLSGMKKTGFVSKEFKPGNVTARIVDVKFEKKETPLNKKGLDEYELSFYLETPPLADGFVGFDKVFGDPSQGQYTGQVRWVKTSDWPIKHEEFVSKKGENITRSVAVQVAETLETLSALYGKPNWLHETAAKVSKVEDLVKFFVQSKMYKDVYLDWLIAGQEDMNAKGYKVYYCYFPTYKMKVDSFVNLKGKEVDTFNSSIHIVKSKRMTEASESLNNDNDEPETTAENPFETSDDDDDELFDMED